MKCVNLPSIPMCDLSAEQVRWLILLEQDIGSAMIAFADYHAARTAIRNPLSFALNEVGSRELIHYAKVFVCAMRRVARILEKLHDKRSVFPKEIADTIKLAWQKRRVMLNSYKDPRDAIEHIAIEVPDKDAWQILNLVGDKLCVTEDVAAEISEQNLLSVIEAWSEIIWSITRHMLIGTGNIISSTETDD